MTAIYIERIADVIGESSQFRVTFPDGSQVTIWAPPWNGYTKEQEDTAALVYAETLWLSRIRKERHNDH